MPCGKPIVIILVIEATNQMQHVEACCLVTKLRRMITCDHDHPDACIGAVADGVCHLRPWWVTQTRKAQEHHAALNLWVAVMHKQQACKADNGTAYMSVFAVQAGR